MVLPRLKEMNQDMVNAAYDLGANYFQMLKEVMLPYLTPGIIAGYFMAFTYSLDDFAVTFFWLEMVLLLYLLRFIRGLVREFPWISMLCQPSFSFSPSS